MNFEAYVQSFEQLYLEARGQTRVALPELAKAVPFRSKRILIVAPHPDDECLMAGFALRAQAEWGTQIGVLPFSHGSQIARQSARRLELKAALAILKFELVGASPSPNAQAESLTEELKTEQILSAMQLFKPDAVILPHFNDGHITHERCALLAKKALLTYAKESGTTIHLFESEFWQSHPHPRFLIPLSLSEVSKMGSALLCHEGEVARNPYHLTLPAWLMDQVRRGSEIQKGNAKGLSVFGQIYGYEEISGEKTE